jgi:hypothetical protein
MTKKNSNNKTALIKAFRDGSLPPKKIGFFYELIVKYRGYYINNKNRAVWAGPWRNDNMAAAMDTFPYAQQGFETGVRMKQS